MLELSGQPSLAVQLKGGKMHEKSKFAQERVPRKDPRVRGSKKVYER